MFYYRLVWGKAPKPETKGPKLKDAFSFGRKDTLLTKHFTFLVGISGYLSLVKTEEHGTMAELSGKRERAIMTHHFLRKVSTCGSMEGRGTGTGSIWGHVRCREDGVGGSDWRSLQASLQLPSPRMSLLPRAWLRPPSDRKHTPEPFPVLVPSRPMPAAPRPPRTPETAGGELSPRRWENLSSGGLPSDLEVEGPCSRTPREPRTRLS